ncbi:MAG: hypothetical protein MZV63_56375 [Marinilabiliales bacterium]|nr:hypothetical protein [Marinilabiliales bacterium]
MKRSRTTSPISSSPRGFPAEYKLKKFEAADQLWRIAPCQHQPGACLPRHYAFIKRRGYVIPEDVRAVAYDVLRHRIGLTYEAEAENITSEDIINEMLNTVEVP